MQANKENMIEWLSGDDEMVLTITDRRAMTMIEHNGWEPSVINNDGSKMYHIPFDRLRCIKAKQELSQEEIARRTKNFRNHK